MKNGFVVAAFHQQPGLVFSKPATDPANPWPEVDSKQAAPSALAIVTWRTALSEKYQSQLEQPLDWDEASTFQEQVEVDADAQQALFYATAVLSLRGEEAATTHLATLRKLSVEALERSTVDVEKLGYHCQFPQLLLRADYWLPFSRDLIIEEPDWNGRPCRFGSLVALRRELDQVELFLQRGRQASKSSSAILDNAVFCLRTLSALSTIAWAKKLPLWRLG
jgi:hypothetical protein